MLDRRQLIATLCPPLDEILTHQLLEEYESAECRYALRDWGPTTLDVGQLAEAASRILYHVDSGTIDRARSVDKCLFYVLDLDKSGLPLKVPNSHLFPDRKAAQEAAKVIRLIYGFRSRRGAVHISPDYTANQLDSQMVVSSARWVVCEIIRIFSGASPSEVAALVQGIVRLEVPGIGIYGQRKLVQHTALNAEEEVLLLLHYSGAEGMRQSFIVHNAVVGASSVSRALSSLRCSARRQVVQVGGVYRITDLGIRRVIEDVVPKLTG